MLTCAGCFLPRALSSVRHSGRFEEPPHGDNGNARLTPEPRKNATFEARNALASCGKSTLITVCPMEDSQVFASVPIKWKEKRVATKTTGAPKPPSKTEVLASLAEKTGLSKKQVGDVLQAYTEEVTKSLGKKGRECSQPSVWSKSRRNSFPPRKLRRACRTRSSRAN